MFAKSSKPASMECVADLPKTHETFNSKLSICKSIKDIPTRKYWSLIEMKLSSNNWLIAPPPEPPDVVVMTLLNLPLLLTGTERFTATQYYNIAAYKLISNTLQVFDEMLKCNVGVWNAILSRCIDNEQNVAFKLVKDVHRTSNTHGNYTFPYMLVLCSLKLFHYGDMLVIFATLQFEEIIQTIMYTKIEVLDALVSSHCRHGRIGCVLQVFFDLPYTNLIPWVRLLFALLLNVCPHEDLTKKLNTFNLVFVAKNIWVLEDSNETHGAIHGAIIVEIAKALVNCVSLVLYRALISYKIEFSNHVEIELVHVLIALDIVWKIMSNSIYGNVFKLTYEVYLVTLKVYVQMRCSFKIGFVEVGKVIAYVALALCINHILSSHVINLASSFQQCSLNICCCNCHPTELDSVNEKRMWQSGCFAIYSPLILKLSSTLLYANSYPLTKGCLMFLHHVVLVVVLHRKMIYKGSFHASKVLTKLKNWLPKHGSRKLAANVDFVVAILHRKMILRGKLLPLKSFPIFSFDTENLVHEYVTAKFRYYKVTVSDFVCVNGESVHVPLAVLKWKTLPPKH
ncbi:pentatricopeptide repeat-containing protein, partial [Trifolium medium]|nr:pentatricopeptide repeat-containing protein [Trifolium medium]